MKSRRTFNPARYKSVALFVLILMVSTFIPATTPVQAATIIEITSTEDLLAPGPTEGCTLRAAIIAANERRAEQNCPAGGAETRIVLPPFAGRLELIACLPKITANVTFSGDLDRPYIISAQNYNGTASASNPPCRVFFVESGQVRFEHLIIAGGVAGGGRGGDGIGGGGGGGGGAGMGGGLFVSNGTVTLSNMQIIGNQAVGGAGGAGSVKGTNGGGGGGGGARFDGTTGMLNQGGNGGGGGALYNNDSDNQGGGAGGFVDTTSVDVRNGKAGTDGGGGGGGSPCPASPSGQGGFPGYGSGGGGGGGCANGGAGFGAAGGFGGGAGGAGVRLITSTRGISGGNASAAYGGTSGNGTGSAGGAGGGGAGLGGGIFIRSGTLVVNATVFSENKVFPGAAGATASGGDNGNPGEVKGSAIFADNAAQVSFGQDNKADDISPIPINGGDNITLIRNAFTNPSVPVVTVSATLSSPDTTSNVVGSFTLNFTPRPAGKINATYTLEGTASPEQYSTDPPLQPGGGLLSVDPAQLDATGNLIIRVTRTLGNLSSSGRTIRLRIRPTASYVVGARDSDELTITQGIPPWLIMLYIAGDDQVPTKAGVNPNLVRSLSEPMNQLINRLTATLPHSDTYRLVVLTDGNQPEDSRLYVSDPTPLGGTPTEPASGLQEIPQTQLPSWFPSNRELDMGKSSTLQSFVRWSKEQYAGYRYSMIAIVGHGGGWAQDIESIPQPARSNVFLAGGWRGLSVDMGSVPVQSSGTEVGISSLSTLDTGQVFAGLGDLGKFDIMFFDACLMGMAESLYEVRDYANYIIAGENILWGELPYEVYLAGITRTTEPRALAVHIVNTYNKNAPDNEPFTIAAVDTQQLGNVRAQLDDLAAKLLLNLKDPAKEAAALALIKQVYAEVQKLDYNADLEIDQGTDGYVDLAHLAQLISDKATEDDIQVSAQALAKIITDTAVITLNRRLAPGNVAQLNTTWDLTNTHGLSIYFPLGEEDCRPTTTTNNSTVKTWDCKSVRPDWASDSSNLPSVVYQRQLPEYLKLRNLSFVRHAPNWAALLAWLDADGAIPNIVSQSFSPFQVSGQTRTYMPFIAKRDTRLAELSGSIAFSPPGYTFRANQPVQVTITVTNTGLVAARPFWVELYIDPKEAPLGPNIRWSELCRQPDIGCFGIVWEFAQGLKPGESRSLVSTIDSDLPQTVWPGCFSVGTRQLYLSVDSWDPGVTFGRVEESNEKNNIVPITITVLPALDGSVCPGTMR